MGFTGTVEKIIKLKMMRARVTEIGFVLRYDRKPSDSKVATSITTLGYFVLIAKYIYPWGDEGKLWQKRVAERAGECVAAGRAGAGAVRLDGYSCARELAIAFLRKRGDLFV